jgi:5-methylcytosine-specific restriction endonuclease McrA
MPKKATKARIRKERDPEKIEGVLKQKGYPGGKLPRGRVLHHIIPISEGGKTTRKNTRVITKTKHKQIHANRKKRGET